MNAYDNNFKDYAAVWEMTRNFVLRVGEEAAVAMYLNGDVTNRAKVSAFLHNNEGFEYYTEEMEETISAVLDMIPQTIEQYC